jgi:hypothetical protein
VLLANLLSSTVARRFAPSACLLLALTNVAACGSAKPPLVESSYAVRIETASGVAVMPAFGVVEQVGNALRIVNGASGTTETAWNDLPRVSRALPCSRHRILVLG